MLKRIVVLALLTASMHNVHAGWVITVKNETPNKIHAKLNALGFERGIDIEAGQQKMEDVGGTCIWFIQISDAAALEKAPAAVDLNYGTGEHCRDKTIKVKRAEQPLDASADLMIANYNGTGNLPASKLAWRAFTVHTEPYAQATPNSGDFKNDIVGIIPS